MRGRVSTPRVARAVGWLTAALGLAMGAGMVLSPAGAGTSGADDAGTITAVTDVACPTASRCTAVDAHGDEVTFDPRNPATPRAVSGLFTMPTGFLAKAIDCPALRQCTVVGGNVHGGGAKEVSFDPTAPGHPTLYSLTSDSGDHPLRSVSCPTRSQCTGGAQDGSVVTFDPAHPEAATLSTVYRPGAPLFVSCPNARRCTAVGNKSLNGGFAVTFDPTRPQSAVVANLPGRSGREAVDCRTAARCVAVTSAGQEIVFAPTDPAAGVVRLVADAELVAVACPTLTQCTAVGRADDDQFVRVTVDPS